MIIWSVNFQNLTKGPKPLIWVLAAPVNPHFHLSCLLINSVENLLLCTSLVDDKILYIWDHGKLVSLKYGPLTKFSVKYNVSLEKLYTDYSVYFQRGIQNHSHQIVGHQVLYMVLKPPCNSSLKSSWQWDIRMLYRIYDRTF